MKKKNQQSEEPVAPPVVPSPAPEWLSETASNLWRKVSADLIALEIYDPTLDELLGAYCVAMGAMVDASLRGDAPQAALIAQIRGLAVSLGIDPVNRKKMQPKPPGPFDDIPCM